MVFHMILYTQKGGKQMSKKKKRKEKKFTIEYELIIINAIVNLIIGILLLIIEKIFF